MLEFKNKNKIEEEIKKYKNITTFISIIRLFLAFVVLVMIVLLFSLQEFVLYSILSAIFIVIFLLVIFFTNKLYYKYNHLKKIKLAYEIHEQRRSLKLDKFYDTGAEFIIKDDYKLVDLDIFGKNSIYQYLNVAKTYDGRKLLAGYLINGNPDKEKTKCLVDKLAKDERSIDVEASILEHNYNSKNIKNDEINNLTNIKEKIKPTFFIPLLSYVITITLLVLIPLLIHNWLFIIIPLFFNLFTTKVFVKSEVFLLDSSLYNDIISKDLKIVDEFNKLNIDDPYYIEIKNNLLSSYDNAKKLKSMYSLLSSRKNIIFNVLFNTIFILDLVLYLVYQKKANKLQSSRLLFDNVNVIEALLSLANIGIDNEIYTMGECGDKFEFKKLAHPLVKNCVSNDLTFDGGIILTGSNMSGKTTFMRTIGVNQILARAGGLVLAEKFIYPDSLIFTSLRTNDLLSEGISTFYAEILRMKKINENLDKGIVILIDEIFKGTNLEERLTAAKYLVKKFNDNKSIFIISTHDYEICDFENITNYHFEEEYDKENKIHFNYKIKEGKSTTKNALYLLKLADII